MNLTLLHGILAGHLVEIADTLPNTYRLTLVARYVGDEHKDADLLVTDDDLSELGGTIERLRKREERKL